MILRKTFNNLLTYFIFLFIGLYIKLLPGFYIYNVLIILFLAMNHGNLKIKKQVHIVLLVFSSGLLFTLLTQISYIDTFGLGNYYIFLNVLIFVSFLLFIRLINFRVLNYNVILVFIIIPIILSILMFFNSSIEQALLSFYNVGRYPAFGRYGGIFGEDVNALGIYASLVLILNMALYKYNKIHLILFISVISVSLFVIILSGMRTGFLVFFGLLLFFNFKLKILNYRILLSILAFSIAVLSILYYYNESSQALIEYIINRFSISHLLNGLSSSEGGGNLRHAIDYFHRTVGNLEFNIYTILFGLDSSINFVDNFYVFLFLKHGLFGVVLFIMPVFYFLVLTIQQKNYIGLYFLLASIVIALKGIFIINNFYMLIVLFTIYFWRTFENIVPNNLTQQSKISYFERVKLNPTIRSKKT